MVRIGEKVPEFMADAMSDGKIAKIKIGGPRKGWSILIFYPADFTFVCPTELEEAARLYDDFKKHGAEVFSVSTDTAYSHLAWHQTSPSISKIRFPMVADPTGRLCREFGTYIEDEGLSLRGTFIIDPDGILKTVEMHDNGIGRNISETLRKLTAAIHVREHPGEACPVNWEPGKKSLKKTDDLVGKI